MSTKKEEASTFHKVKIDHRNDDDSIENIRREFNTEKKKFQSKMKPVQMSNEENTTETKGSGKKVTIVVDEDDPCLKKEEEKEEEKPKFRRSSGLDPRFQQQNQTLRCYVMYTDFYRCEHLLGEGADACTWFKDVFTSICPIAWVAQWDELRINGRLPWHKYKTQGNFPGDKYGV